MPDMTMAPAEPLVEIPLPRFGRQPTSDPLPDDAIQTPAATDSLSEGRPPEAGSPSPQLDLQESPDGASPPPPVPSLDPPTRTGTSSGRGGANAKTAGEVLAGLVGVACGIAYTWAARRGWFFRQPTKADVDAFTQPLGEIAARHMNTDLISPDIVAGTRAVKAAHDYVLGGPMFTRLPREPQGDELP